MQFKSIGFVDQELMAKKHGRCRRMMRAKNLYETGMKLTPRKGVVEMSSELDSEGESTLLGNSCLQCEALLGDAEIRPALRMRISSTLGIDEDTAIIEELGLCRGLVRIDLAVVNGSIHGYEIKSERDSLRRLAGQAAVYSRVLDQATLVAATRHITDALEIVPAWWGILRFKSVAGNMRFKSVRQGRRNPERDSRSLVELLWLDDALNLLERHDAARGVKGKPRRVVWDRVCETIAVDEIAAAVRMRLKARVMQPTPALLS